MSRPQDLDRRRAALVLALLALWYLLATVPHLADFPVQDWPQMGIAAPAWKLASEGVYGNDLFAGYHRSERRNYEYMPAYPLLVALSFKILGLGVFEARLVSLLCGLLAIFLTFELGRRLHGRAVGVAAAAGLCVLKLGLFPDASGIPWLDFSRVIRYDVLVPAGVLTSVILFLRAGDLRSGTGRGPSAGYFLGAGGAAGVATLAHVYGAFILAVLAGTLVWHRGGRGLREAPLYLLAAGWSLAMAPWLLYVLQDYDAYAGQMSRHAGRFDLLDPAFYWQNLVREPWRYRPWLQGGFPATFLQPRVGIWWLVFGVPASLWWLWQRTRSSGALGDRFLLLAFPLLQLCMGLLLALKRHVYTVLVLPFLTLLVAYFAVELWRRAAGWRWRRAVRCGLMAAVLLTVIEGASGVARALASARAASSYEGLSRKIAGTMPAGSRLLISQPYWLGLEKNGDFELRSLHMVFLMAESMTVAEAMARLAPDGVVLESYFLEERPNDRRAPPPGSAAHRTFLEIARYLRQRCPDVVRHEDPDYGTVETYRCK